MFKLFKYLAPDKRNMVFVALFLLVTTLSSLALPTLMSAIVDNGINRADISYIFKISMIMLAIAVAGLWASIAAVKLSSKVTARFSNSLRSAVFKKINTLSFEKLNEFGMGALITRSTQDIWMLEEVSFMLLRGIIVIPILVVGGTVLAVMKNPWLALIMFSCTPILVAVLYIISKRIKPLWDLSDKYIDLQNSIIRERLAGIRVIRAFNREDKECEKAARATRVMAKNIIKSNVHAGIISPLSIFLFNFITIAILYVGAVSMQNPSSMLTAGDIIAVIQYVTLVLNGILNISFIVVLLPHVKVNCGRINEVLDSESLPEADDLDKERFSGDITFKNVKFCYGKAEEPVISDLSLSVKAGEKVAFIGGTGSGKTTIVNLLMAFYAPTEGEILFGENSVSTMSAKRVRQNISCVLQKTTLFEGTLKYNISMSDSSASDERIEKAAETAELKEFISQCKDGLEYAVQPGGTNLSGGQKQRISIARALLKDAPVYIFDDSFSALDFLTEARLRKKLNKELASKTQIIVTQRIASAMHCDKIFVLDKGRLTASGKHSELLESCPLYREIYLSQTGGGLNEK